MDIWIQIVALNLSFFTLVLAPTMLFFFKKFQRSDQQIMLIKEMVKEIHHDSKQADIELERNWVHFYHNEIMRFWERIQVKPDVVPSQEHYRSVFENYDRYKKLGGMQNGYVGAIMNSIRTLYEQQHGVNQWPPVLNPTNHPKDNNK